MAAPVFSSIKELMALIAPPWLYQAQGAAFLRALADVKDYQVQRTRDGVKARFPEYAPREGLRLLGGERMLPRAPDDTDIAYATRLRIAWDLWPWAGTDTGILRALFYLGYTNAMLVSQQGMHSSLDGSGNLVRAQGTPLAFSVNLWTRFALVFPQPHIARWVSDGIPTQSSNEGQLIVRTVRLWKPAMAGFNKVVITGTAPLWGFPLATAKWGAVGRVWGGGTPSTTWQLE